MPLTAVTYIRSSDRTRIVFLLNTPDTATAETTAFRYAPHDFEYAATCEPTIPMQVPSDGDDYGVEAPSIPADWITTTTQRPAG